jgi:release factor glutamine methyltransferase
VTVQQPSIRPAVERLTASGIASPEHDARALAAYSERTGADFDELVRRRARREPLQHILGSVGFRYIELQVGRGVFVPRPESEVVAGIAVDLARRTPAPTVVDLCSGSGAIALAVANEVRDAKVHAVELDPEAFDWLRRNADERAAAGDPAVELHAQPVVAALPDLDGQVDVVVSNPPYVGTDELESVDPEVRDHDPQVALVAGPDGLDVIREVAGTAWRLLRPDGWLVVEHSDRQGETAPEVLAARGFVDVSDRPDLTGRPRVAVGRRP